MDILPVVSIAASLIAIWFLWFFLIRDLRVETFRQKVFELRDQLFDLAAAGDISFQDPAYGALRSTLNNIIRFAHKISLFRLLPFLLVSRIHGNCLTQSRTLKLLDEMPDGNAKDALRLIHGKASIQLVRFLIPPFCVAAFCHARTDIGSCDRLNSHVMNWLKFVTANKPGWLSIVDD